MSTPLLPPPGSFSFTLPSGAWAWSEHTFAIFGLDPHRDVPTTELWMRHQHPDDHAAVARFMNGLKAGGSGALWHRVVRADGRVREVVTTVEVSGADRGRHSVHGQVVDVSEGLRLAAAREVDAALEQLSRSRPVIDQAKGALMLTYRLDADAAFELLRSYSQRANVKVREVASLLVLPGGWSERTRLMLDQLVAELRHSASEENPGA